MKTPRWKPSVTVAAVIDRVIQGEQRFLMVEEETPEGVRFNNPAGHLDPGESPLDGVVREVLEETACAFTPVAFQGVYLSRFLKPDSREDVTYLRLAFSGTVGDRIPGRHLDTGIIRAVWMTIDQIRASKAQLRSPLVLRCIEDYLAGRRYPLDACITDASVFELALPG